VRPPRAAHSKYGHPRLLSRTSRRGWPAAQRGLVRPAAPIRPLMTLANNLGYPASLGLRLASHTW
jgi:hypothetical protein